MPHTEKKLQVLILEKSAKDCDRIILELKRLPYSIHYKRISSIVELKNELPKRHWSLMIAGNQYESFSVLEALEELNKQYQKVPLIVVADKISEEGVADLMMAGVVDIVMKSRLERVASAVNRIMREHDIHEKEIKAQRVATEAHAAKEQMLAIVSHDIKNPLSAIQLEAQSLVKAAKRNEGSSLAEEVIVQSNRILKITDRLKSLISDLLDQNKSKDGLSTLSRQNINVLPILQEALDSCHTLIKQKNIIVKTEIPSDLKPLLIDRNKIFQVFSNLLINAIKFTPEEGVICASVVESPHNVTFSIHDSGPGLKKTDLSKVFEKYWTGGVTGSSGTGLGLFICKTIVTAHSGRIMVENCPEGGAKFWFSLPKSLHSSLQFIPVEHRKSNRKKIFVIDDDEDLREVISWALGKEGFSIDSFHDPEEALKVLKKGETRPDLILVDYHLEKMKGGDFLNLKSKIPEYQSCPVVMISGSPHEVESEVNPNLYNEIISKPLDLESLVDNISKYLH